LQAREHSGLSFRQEFDFFRFLATKKEGLGDEMDDDDDDDDDDDADGTMPLEGARTRWRGGEQERGQQAACCGRAPLWQHAPIAFIQAPSFLRPVSIILSLI